MSSAMGFAAVCGCSLSWLRSKADRGWRRQATPVDRSRRHETPERNTYAPNVANSAQTNFPSQASTTGYDKATGSLSSPNTARKASHASRTARAAKSPTSTRTGHSRSRSTGQTPASTRAPRRRVAAACLRPTPLPPTRRNRRSRRRGHRRWQTSKETAYVQATRARHGTDWYLARD